MLTALLLAALALLAIPVSRALSDDYVPPAALVVAAWCGTLALFCLRALPYPPLAPATRWLIALTIVCLAGGCVLGAVAGVRRRRAVAAAPALPASIGWWIAGFSLLGMAGVAWYVWSIVTILGWEALRDPIRIRGALHTYEIPSRFLFLQFFCLVSPLVAFAAWLAGLRVHRAIWIGPVLCAASTWLSTDRTQFFLLLLTAFFMYVFRHGRALRPRGFALAALACAALLATNFLVIGALLGKTAASWYITRREPAIDQSRDLRPRPVLVALALRQEPAAPPAPDGLVARGQEYVARQLRRTLQLYAYATGSYRALDMYLQEPHARTGGRHVLYPLLRPFDRLGLLAPPLPSPFPPFRMAIPHPNGQGHLEFNAYTFLFYPLEDFGPAGALVYALGVGLACGWCYGRARRDRADAVGLLVVGQLSTALVLTVFVNKFNNTAWWYVLAATLAPFLAPRVWRAMRRRSPAAP